MQSKTAFKGAVNCKLKQFRCGRWKASYVEMLDILAFHPCACGQVGWHICSRVEALGKEFEVYRPQLDLILAEASAWAWPLNSQRASTNQVGQGCTKVSTEKEKETSESATAEPVLTATQKRRRPRVLLKLHRS